MVFGSPLTVATDVAVAAVSLLVLLFFFSLRQSALAQAFMLLLRHATSTVTTTAILLVITMLKHLESCLFLYQTHIAFLSPPLNKINKESRSKIER